MNAFELADLLAAQQASGMQYHEFLRVPALNAGIYVLAAGSNDQQQPHAQDEVYYVVEGTAMFTCDGQADVPVKAGTVLYVEAGIGHRFVNIQSDLTILVLFAG